MRTYAQSVKTVWDNALLATVATPLAAGGASVGSGSFASIGYARLTGIVYSDASMSAACGIRVRQSSTSVPNWDWQSTSGLSACSGSSFSVEVTGRYASVELFTGATCAASILRAYVTLRPI